MVRPVFGRVVVVCNYEFVCVSKGLARLVVETASLAFVRVNAA